MYICWPPFLPGSTSALLTVFFAGRSSAFDFFLCLLFLFFLFIVFIFPLFFFDCLLFYLLWGYYCLFLFIYCWLGLQLCVTAWLEMSGCHPFASSWSQSFSFHNVFSSVWQLGLDRPSCHPFASSWSWRFILFLVLLLRLGSTALCSSKTWAWSFVVMLLVWLLPICKLLEFRDSDFLLWLGQ